MLIVASRTGLVPVYESETTSLLAGDQTRSGPVEVTARDDVRGAVGAVSVDRGARRGQMRHLPGAFGWNG